MSKGDPHTSSLFADPESGAGSNDHRPLADLLRPESLDDFVGQDHLLSEGKPLRTLADRGDVCSMILWGPPGTGKTTLARLLAHNSGAELVTLSAVMAGVKEVRVAVEQARVLKAQGRRTLLFVDEVHRFNNAQQDAFLPHVEDGTVTFIGATTENPSFEVNNALLSRARVFVLKPFDDEALLEILKRAGSHVSVDIEHEACMRIVQAADGDARRALNLLELAAQLGGNRVSAEHVDQALGERVRRFDKGGDEFYEQISALHKSVRGSHPDAALYWFCRMLDGGADPRYLGRRLVRMASEDIGNADPRALSLANDALATFERLGSPEGELALAQTVLYLAAVPKSDAAYQAFGAAMAYVREQPSMPVPEHLRNAPTALMKTMGYGADYRHAHGEITEEGAYAVGERYFPDGVPEQAFYQPTDQGLEQNIRNRLQRLRSLDDEANESRKRND